MRARIDIDRALADRNLLGAALGDLTPWKVWRVVLKAAFALGLGTDEERAIFEEISGGRPLPAKRVRELWAVVARRGGKSRMAAAWIAPVSGLSIVRTSSWNRFSLSRK